jgi:error-prone DNA polymerase
MGFYAPGTLIEDAQRHGVVVLPVDVTRSGWDHSLEERCSVGCPPKAGGCARDSGPEATGAHHALDETVAPRPEHRAPSTEHRRVPAVRLGLRSIRGLGAKTKERVERALAEGPFTSIADVARRSGLDRRALRHLAEAGALDTFLPDEPDAARRRTAIWRMLDELRGDAGPLAPRIEQSAVRSPQLPSMSPVEITEADYRLTGFSLNGHPLKHLRPLLARNGIKSAREVERCRDGDRVGVAGLVICRQRPGTAKGFVFLTLEDETGLVNVVVIPKRFEHQALLISTAPLLLVRGTLQVEGTVINLRGERFHPLEADVGAEWAQRHDFH